MTSREPPLNTAACRLLLDIMPGLETAVVFQEKVLTKKKSHRFIKFSKNVYLLVASGLGCGTWRVGPLLRHVGSSVAAHRLSSWGWWAP